MKSFNISIKDVGFFKPIFIMIVISVNITSAQILTKIDIPGSITIAGIRSSGSDNNVRYTIGDDLSSLSAAGFTIYDLSNKNAPLPIIRFSKLSDEEFQVWNDYKFIGLKEGPEEAIINRYISPNLRLVGYFPTPDKLLLNQDGFLYAIYNGITMYEINYNHTSPLPVWDGGKQGNNAYVEGFELYDFHGIRSQHIYELSDPENPKLMTTNNDFQIQYHSTQWIHEKYNFEGCEKLAIHPILTTSNKNDEEYVNRNNFTGYDQSRMNDQLYVDENLGYLSHYIVGFRMFINQNLNNLILDIDSLSGDTNDLNNSRILGINPSFKSDQFYIFDPSGIYIFSRRSTKSADVYKIKNKKPILLSSKNYPNPFNNQTTIEFELNENAHVSLKIFNALGEEVETLVHENMKKGNYNRIWDAGNIASGIYFYQLSVNTKLQKSSNSTTSINRIVLLK